MFSSVCRKEREKKEKKKKRCYTSIIECIKKERALTTLHDQTTAMPLSFSFLDVYLLPFYTVFFFILLLTVMERFMKVAADLLVDEQFILRYCPIV